MQYPNTRIHFARSLSRQLAAEAQQEASTITADAVRLIRERGCSPEFATRHARARILTLRKAA